MAIRRQLIRTAKSFAMHTSLRQKEVVRGKILYYLALIFPQPAALQLLQGELDFFGYPVPLDELSFHVAYLQEKGLVAIEPAEGPALARAKKLIKITAKGIDFYDGRLPPDEGIWLEPKG